MHTHTHTHILIWQAAVAAAQEDLKAQRAHTKAQHTSVVAAVEEAELRVMATRQVRRVSECRVLRCVEYVAVCCSVFYVGYQNPFCFLLHLILCYSHTLHGTSHNARSRV